MGLNIKNNETLRLADEVARLTGETKTGAITVVLREHLEHEKRARSVETRVQEIRAFAERCAKLMGLGAPFHHSRCSTGSLRQPV